MFTICAPFHIFKQSNALATSLFTLKLFDCGDGGKKKERKENPPHTHTRTRTND